MYANKISSQAWGMAIFFRRNRFTLLETRRLDLTRIWDRYDDLRALVESNAALEEQMRQTSTVAQLMLLQTCDRHGATGKTLAVVNTHLFSHPMSPHVRMMQTAIIVREVERLHPGTALVYCGDFNADSSSGAYTLLAQGSVSERHFEWAEGHAGLGLLASGSKAEREENWHAALSPQDAYAMRAAFVSAGAREGGDADGKKLAAAWDHVKGLPAGPAEGPLPPALVAALDAHMEAARSAAAPVTYDWLFTVGVEVKGMAPQLCEALFRKLARAAGELAGGDAARLADAIAAAHQALPAQATVPPRPDGSGQPAALPLQHPLRLKSALAGLPVSYCAGKPPTPSVVDHMFYSEDLLRPSQAPYPNFTLADVKDGLPNACMPSDHCAVLCDFEWYSAEDAAGGDQAPGAR